MKITIATFNGRYNVFCDIKAFLNVAKKLNHDIKNHLIVAKRLYLSRNEKQ